MKPIPNLALPAPPDPWRRWVLAAPVALLAALALSALPQRAWALEVKPYSAEAFEAARQAKRPVAVHFRTSWCTVCKAQQVLLNQMQDKREPGYDLTVLAVDYDKDMAARQLHKVKERSTLVVYGGGVEKSRLEGSADESKIKAALKAGLSK